MSPAISSRLVADTGAKVKSFALASYLKNLPSPRFDESTSVSPISVLPEEVPINLPVDARYERT